MWRKWRRGSGARALAHRVDSRWSASCTMRRAMAEEVDARERFEGPDLSGDEGGGEGFAFGAPAEHAGAATEAWSSAAKTEVRGPAKIVSEPSGAAPRPSRPPADRDSTPSPAAVGVVDAPAYVRRAEAAAKWSELRSARGEAAAVAREALDSLDRLEGMLARLASSTDDSSYRLRLAEGLVHSLRDVLAEFGDEADLVTRGSWKLLLLG
jgi:hypothetical protein